MKDTGGPAFPTMLYEHGGESDGMTLRDYFAAKAMQSMNARPDYADTPADAIALDAYALADAMLAERNKT
jgi:hypothetical protein